MWALRWPAAASGCYHELLASVREEDLLVFWPSIDQAGKQIICKVSSCISVRITLSAFPGIQLPAYAFLNSPIGPCRSSCRSAPRLPSFWVPWSFHNKPQSLVKNTTASFSGVSFVYLYSRAMCGKVPSAGAGQAAVAFAVALLATCLFHIYRGNAPNLGWEGYVMA